VLGVVYTKKVPGTGNSALTAGSGAVFVRLFFIKNIISGHIESAIDKNRK